MSLYNHDFQMAHEKVTHCATERGMSVLVGTVDANGVPACCRGLAILSRDELTTATVFVPVATSHSVIGNVATTKRIAVVAANPPDHWSIQLKGVTTMVRLARDEEEPIVRDRFAGFAEALHRLGIPRRVTGGVTQWPAFAIEFEVQQVYEQTPGPKAGTPLR